MEGSRLLTARGERVDLHGINLGGWLVTEGWMCGMEDAQDAAASAGGGGRSAMESLEGRFGPGRATQLMQAWRDHWITPRDLDQVRDAGFNLVRVPFSYRTLQQADGSWTLDADGAIDFSRMDWIVREAARRGLYTLFDLHVWPGQREAYDRIGRPEGAQTRLAMSRLWTAVAAHYRGQGAVAGFDLINEFPGAWGVQQDFSRAVRAADPDRVQVVEGFTLAEFLKLHAQGEFPGSLFSEHLYGQRPLTTQEIADRLKDDQAAPVPVYIGEFLAADFPAATRLMNAAGVSWSSWTYKTVDEGQWGMFDYHASLRTDIQKDDFQDILDKWTHDLTAWQSSSSTPNSFINENRTYSFAPRYAAYGSLGQPPRTARRSQS